MPQRATVWDFVAIFEHSPILLSRLLPLVGPDDGPEDVIERARSILLGLDERERVAILNAHPRIGDDVRTLSELSAKEQGVPSDASTLRELESLNERYERTFGFRFVVFVAGRAKSEIVPILRERLARTRDEELRTGIEEFLAISLDRLRRAR